jgi:hypothetical protein
MSTVMLFGIGDLGGWTLEFLARSEGVSNIIACDIREDFPRMKTECVAIGAGQQGYTKDILFQKCDVTDTDATVELLKKHNPDVIYSALTLLGWMEMRVIPRAVGEDYHKATACLIPLNVPLISRLMKARNKACLTAPVINNSYPDVTNVVLWRNGLGPLVGAGNLDISVGEIRRKLSILESVPMRDVTVYLIAGHAIVSQGTRTGMPFFFKAMVGDKNITDKHDIHALISDSLFRATPADKARWLNEPYIAASAVRNIKAIINDTNEFAHSPGPNGLPGGYPMRIGARGVEVVLPKEVTLEEAVKINLDGLKYDGVEEIKKDGTVVLTTEAYDTGEELYGLGLREYRFADMEDIARELVARVKRISAKYG